VSCCIGVSPQEGSCLVLRSASNERPKSRGAGLQGGQRRRASRVQGKPLSGDGLTPSLSALVVILLFKIQSDYLFGSFGAGSWGRLFRKTHTSLIRSWDGGSVPNLGPMQASLVFRHPRILRISPCIAVGRPFTRPIRSVCSREDTEIPWGTPSRESHSPLIRVPGPSQTG